ncbi:hypothetical protein ACQ4PT_066003 [Festuca glaucescens]
MAQVKVFGSARFTNAARELVCLEEVGVAYEVVDIDFPSKEHKSPEHLARNPFGVIPAFQDGDLMLFESRAIAKYILRKYRTNEVDMLREGNLQEATMVDIWTEVEAHQYNKALAPIVMECIIYPTPTAYGIPTNQKVVDESVELKRSKKTNLAVLTMADGDGRDPADDGVETRSLRGGGPVDAAVADEDGRAEALGPAEAPMDAEVVGEERGAAAAREEGAAAGGGEEGAAAGDGEEGAAAADGEEGAAAADVEEGATASRSGALPSP